ncbi:hypothetical protein O0D34_00475 [Staphylococcus pseudintermedius]|nr:hypothetical protein [Staphylococcus pseudintermedius]
MKIKLTKEFKLLELFEYIKKNEIADKVFFDNKGKGKVVVGDDRYLYMTDLNLTDTFTVEVEEEITEETVIPLLLDIYDGRRVKAHAIVWKNKSIKGVFESNKTPSKTFHIINDDGTLTLIWKDGELV